MNITSSSMFNVKPGSEDRSVSVERWANTRLHVSMLMLMLAEAEMRVSFPRCAAVPLTRSRSETRNTSVTPPEPPHTHLSEHLSVAAPVYLPAVSAEPPWTHRKTNTLFFYGHCCSFTLTLCCPPAVTRWTRLEGNPETPTTSREICNWICFTWSF